MRSPTAEVIFSVYKDWNVCSAGISNDAEVRVSIEDINWADYIFVMEKAHKKKLSNRFSGAIKNKKIISLDIPDNYDYMDPTLIEMLNKKVAKLVD